MKSSNRLPSLETKNGEINHAPAGARDFPIAVAAPQSVRWSTNHSRMPGNVKRLVCDAANREAFPADHTARGY
jgi:hypothetical protein